MNDLADKRLAQFYKSVLDQDKAPIVLCELNHVIIYMNPAAIVRYKKYGGAGLLGKSLLLCHNPKSCDMIQKIVAWFAESKANNIIKEANNNTENRDVYVVALRDDEGNLIGYYEKHEYRNPDKAQCYDFRS